MQLVASKDPATFSEARKEAVKSYYSKKYSSSKAIIIEGSMIGGILAQNGTGIIDNKETKAHKEKFDDKCKTKRICRTVQKRKST